MILNGEICRRSYFVLLSTGLPTQQSELHRLCLFPSFLYNRRMAFDPANPPIWLRKLHVSAAQINPTDYPASAVEGILAVCRLSSAQQRWMTALRAAIEESDRTRSTVPHS